MELRPLLRAGALFVLAGDQLADQSEREELKSDHHQEHSEEEDRDAPEWIGAILLPSGERRRRQEVAGAHVGDDDCAKMGFAELRRD